MGQRLLAGRWSGYFAFTDGQFYSWHPGDEQITNHGTPFPGQGIWRLAVAPDGIVYGGTYPGGRLFSFNPATGAFTDHGQVNPGETYARSVAADDKYVFVGSQPNVKLARWDRATGEVAPLTLPADVASATAVYDLRLAGDYIFARVDPINTLLMYDRESLELVNRIDKVTARVVSPVDPTGNFVYFRANNPALGPVGVYEYDLTTHQTRSIGWNPNMFPGSFSFHKLSDQQRFPGYTILSAYYLGRAYAFNLTTRQGLYVSEAILEATPNPIQTIATGPDGNIYTGGFLSPPGISQFNPADGTFRVLPGAGQVEGIGTFNELLLLGRYPNGLLTAFDTTREWKNNANPPAPFEIGHDQDRPQSMVRVADEVAVASVPKTGRLGGALTMWNPLTNTRRTFPNIVENQSLVSVAEKNGLVYAGTSINGGYGIEPVASEAVIAGIDPSTGKVQFQVAPAPGAATVNALTFGPDGSLWGIVDGALFTFDTQARKVTRHEQLFPHGRAMYGTDRGLVFGEDGYLYAVSGGSLWRVDPASWERIRLATDRVAHLAKDERGNLYYGRVATLFRWNFDLPTSIDAEAPATQASVDPSSDTWVAGPATITLTATDRGGSGVLRTEFRIVAEPWQEYGAPFTITAEGEHVISYRSVDKNSNQEATKSLTVRIDSSAPTTGSHVSGKHRAIVRLDAVDTLSGVDTTYYRVWTGRGEPNQDRPWRVYDGPFTLPRASHEQIVEFYSVDHVGHEERPKTIRVPRP